MKIAIALGTRPEIIKMAPIIQELKRVGCDFFILHTGQHYSYQLDQVFFQQLRLPESRYNLEVASGLHGEQTANIIAKTERVLLTEKPDIIMVQGDTNTVMATTVAASKLSIRIGHVEAGLRSYDRHMPEEINRVIADHCSDYLFAPTNKAMENLLREGIAQNKIFVTGNTIVDSVFQNIELARNSSKSLHNLRLTPKGYFLVTLHRQENVDYPERFRSILAGLDRLVEEYSMPVIYPVHPRSRKRISDNNIPTGNLTLIEPVDFLELLQLEENALLVLTDSGGIQEETCILGVPCVTLRDTTERPETLEVGANMLAGANPERINECAHLMINQVKHWTNPFGDGRAAERIVSIILNP